MCRCLVRMMMFGEDDDDVQMFGEDDDDDVQMFGEDDDVW